MKLQTNWSYESSVKKVSGLVTELKSVTLKKSTLTDEIARELYEAREQLSDRGSWSSGSRAEPHNWTGYLDSCGLARRTVHDWLEHYEPEEQRLLTDDEFQAKQEAKRRAEMSVKEANASMVQEAIKTGKHPNGWNAECQRMYDGKIKENKLRDERMKKWQEDIRRDDAARQSRESERKAKFEDIDSLIAGISENITKRQSFKERIRISHEGKDDPFVDAIMDYLETLTDDNRRIEACYNIIKVCKGIANDLQAKK